MSDYVDDVDGGVDPWAALAEKEQELNELRDALADMYATVDEPREQEPQFDPIQHHDRVAALQLNEHLVRQAVQNGLNTEPMVGPDQIAAQVERQLAATIGAEDWAAAKDLVTEEIAGNPHLQAVLQQSANDPERLSRALQSVFMTVTQRQSVLQMKQQAQSMQGSSARPVIDDDGERWRKIVSAGQSGRYWE